MKKQWWKEAVVYQIYPRSFKDSNGDGIGDIRGIIEKLDYLEDLGIDVVWLSPCYKSPNDDNGYDISDYQSIMDDFGTIEDWEEMIEKMHQRGIKLLMDLVVNHSSDEHNWFLESKKSKDNPYRDYYIWKPSNKDKEPNDWGSFFGGSVWTYDEITKEYYLHLFGKKQPDLNWENERVRNEIYEMMTWWLEKGVDGFRMDVINLISKDQDFPAVGNGENYQWGGEYFMNGPKVHDYLKEMNEKVLSKYDIMTVGETPGATIEDAKLYSGESEKELNMVFQFELMDIDSGEKGKWQYKPWKLSTFKSIISKWQNGLAKKGWNSLYLNNHDQPRMVSRFGNDTTYRKESAKMLATMVHTLQGTPYIFQGEEIGMTNIKLDKIEDYKDIETINMYNEYIKKGIDEKEILSWIYRVGRDNARTPMQWDETINGGFTTGKPWIKANSNHKTINVHESMKDENSIYNYYKKLIKLRKEHEIIVYGSYEELYPEDENIYAYLRHLKDKRLLVILNFYYKPATFTMPSNVKVEKAQLLISNYKKTSDFSNSILLKPYEARVYIY